MNWADTPIEGHTIGILRQYMMTGEQWQLCVGVIGSIALLS